MTRHDPPPGPRGRAALEGLRELRQSPLTFLCRVAAQYGDLVRYPVGPWEFYVATHPDHVGRVLQENQRAYSKDTFQYNLLKTVTGNGLLTSDGAFWLRQRRLAQPAFHHRRVEALDALITAATVDMLEDWERAAARAEPIDVTAAMMQVALRIVGQALFSIDIREEADALAQAVLVVLDHIVERARTLGLAPDWLPTARNRCFRDALNALDRVVYATIAQRRRAGGGNHDLLAMLLAARDEETGEGMSDRQVRDEVMTLLIAGHETVASALAWTWYLLAQAPEVERKLHAEVDAVLGGRPPSATDLPRLAYTRQVFEEALRLYPPAWIITRKTLAADTLGGYHIPAGALVILSPYVTQRRPDLWEGPETFDPERFAPARAAGRPRFAYFPFGGGARLCIGNYFALVEAQLIIASVAQRFRLRLAPDQVVEPEPSVTLRPRHGLLMYPTLRHPHLAHNDATAGSATPPMP